MNFFKEQERARARLAKFKKMFYLTVLLTSFFTALCLYHFPGLTSPFSQNPFGPIFYQTLGFWVIFATTSGFIFLMAWIESTRLRDGGQYIASLADAKELSINAHNPKHKRLRNVIEEMSIAAGIIPPKIFIMSNEPGINAFAAGFSMQDAVIGISQGCLDKLTRDELQGVVAHEVGHIVNGDMKLNLELMGYLFGLMGISDVGRTILRMSDNRKKGNPLILAGSGLFFIGIVGHFLGHLLRLSISRGQEFAADAKSVQYTRNPEGIAGALKKILSIKETFFLAAPKSHKIAHFYLHYPQTSALFATHPPLEERLSKIDPSFKYSSFMHQEKKELKTLMEQDISSQVASSFAAPLAISQSENSVSELIERTLNFIRFVSSKRQEVGALSQLSDRELIEEMDIILGRLRTLSFEDAKKILKEIKEIILSDKKILHQELLCFILFKETLTPSLKRIRKSYGLRNSKDSIRIVLSFLARISSLSVKDQEESYSAGMNKIYSDNLPMLPTFTTGDIIHSLENLRNLVPLAKEKVLIASVVVIEHNMDENFEENLFLKVLKKIMGVATL